MKNKIKLGRIHLTVWLSNELFYDTTQLGFKAYKFFSIGFYTGPPSAGRLYSITLPFLSIKFCLLNSIKKAN